MSWVITGREAGSLGLLDQYAGAAAAYSLRSLTLYYTGPVVRVRRSSDNTEQDFTAAQVTDGTLTTFCGAGDGFVRTWYDQSGNGGHLNQVTTANQPTIVSSGSIITVNTKPGIQTDGSNDFLRCSLAVSTLGISIGLVYKNNGSGGNQRIFDLGNTTGSSASLYASDNFEFPPTGKSFGYRFPENQTVLGPAPGQAQTLASYIRSSTTLQSAWFNNQAFTNTSSTTSFTSQQLTVGASNASLTFLQGVFQELFIYPSNQSTNRVAIEANINAHYAIY
jgi:hypothetical protein